MMVINYWKPAGVSLYAARQQLPGVKETVITTVFSPSHLLCSTMMLAWVNTSCTIIVYISYHCLSPT